MSKENNVLLKVVVVLALVAITIYGFENRLTLLLLVMLAFAAIIIPIAIGKAIYEHKKDFDALNAAEQRDFERAEAAKMKKRRQYERQEAAKRREAERIAAAKAREQRQHEAEMRKKEKERQLSLKEEARMQLAYASLEERYGQAEKRYAEIQRQLSRSKVLVDRIALCKESITLVPLLIDYSMRRHNLDGFAVDTSMYYRDFYYLSKAYEDYGLIDYAIQACNDAMEYGFSMIPEAETFSKRVEELTALKEG